MWTSLALNFNMNWSIPVPALSRMMLASSLAIMIRGHERMQNKNGNHTQRRRTALKHLGHSVISWHVIRIGTNNYDYINDHLGFATSGNSSTCR
jgi:hypothetical protein